MLRLDEGEQTGAEARRPVRGLLCMVIQLRYEDGLDLGGDSRAGEEYRILNIF